MIPLQARIMDNEYPESRYPTPNPMSPGPLNSDLADLQDSSVETGDEISAGLPLSRRGVASDLDLHTRLEQLATQRLEEEPWILDKRWRQRQGKMLPIPEEIPASMEDLSDDEGEPTGDLNAGFGGADLDLSIGQNDGEMTLEQKIAYAVHMYKHNPVDRTTPQEAKRDYGMELYQEIIAANTYADDPLSEWFRRLGIPCHPTRLEREPKRARSVNSSSSKASSSSSSLRPPPSVIGSSASNPSSYQRSGSSLHSASTVTQEVMKEYMGWIFETPGKLTDGTRRDARGVYCKNFQYSSEREALHNITLPPKQKRIPDTQKLQDVDRRIHNNLRQERMRLATIGLVLPVEWRIKAYVQEPPFLRLPAQYQACLSEQEQISTGDRYNPDIEDIIKTESVGSAPYGLSTDTQVVPELKLVRESQPEKERDFREMRDIAAQAKYKLPKRSGRKWDVERTRIAMDLKAVVDEKNQKWYRWHSVHLLIYAVESYRGWPDFVLYSSQEEIEREDRRRHVGDATLNEDQTNYPERCPPDIILNFLKYKGVGAVESEGKVEHVVGSLLTGVIAGKEAVEKHNTPLKFHLHLSALGSNPSPDIYLRAMVDGVAKGWNSKLLPVLFAAECKQGSTHTLDTRAQLATALQATLIILILYYLDTRHSQDSACPPWLFLYGIEYIEHGMWIHAHYPYYDHEAQPPQWKFKAILVTERYDACFRAGDPPDKRMQALAALFKIRSHSLFVLSQLKSWRRGSKVLEVLSKGC